MECGNSEFAGSSFRSILKSPVLLFSDWLSACSFIFSDNLRSAADRHCSCQRPASGYSCPARGSISTSWGASSPYELSGCLSNSPSSTIPCHSCELSCFSVISLCSASKSCLGLRHQSWHISLLCNTCKQQWISDLDAAINPDAGAFIYVPAADDGFLRADSQQLRDSPQ